MLRKGLVQVYSGDGKGKTTAAFGLAMRAAGRGNKVFIYQFLKPASMETGERLALESAGLEITVEGFGMEWDMFKSPGDSEQLCKAKEMIADTLEQVTEMAQNREYDVIILDELVFCLSKGLAELCDIQKLVDSRDECVELVFTGRGVDERLIELADLVSEVRLLKDPYSKSLSARKGIEY